MSVPWAVREPFGDRIKAFVREVYPERRTGIAMGGDFVSNPSAVVDEALDQQGYIRKLRRGDVDQPNAERAWRAAGAMATLSRKRWANPIVMLFVCGHYGHVASIMLSIPEATMTRAKRKAMIEVLPSVPHPSRISTTRSKNRDRLMLEGFDELTAHEAATWEASMSEPERPDRALWSFNVSEYAASLTGWKHSTSGLDMSNPAIATSQFITEHATFAVDDRERIVINLLADALNS